jgi:hypothetical protein
VRKDLKKAADCISEALVHMNKAVNNNTIPNEPKIRIKKIIEAFSIDKDELIKIKDIHFH